MFNVKRTLIFFCLERLYNEIISCPTRRGLFRTILRLFYGTNEGVCCNGIFVLLFKIIWQRYHSNSFLTILIKAHVLGSFQNEINQLIKQNKKWYKEFSEVFLRFTQEFGHYQIWNATISNWEKQSLRLTKLS